MPGGIGLIVPVQREGKLEMGSICRNPRLAKSIHGHYLGEAPSVHLLLPMIEECTQSASRRSPTQVSWKRTAAVHARLFYEVPTRRNYDKEILCYDAGPLHSEPPTFSKLGCTAAFQWLMVAAKQLYSNNCWSTDAENKQNKTKQTSRRGGARWASYCLPKSITSWAAECGGKIGRCGLSPLLAY